MEAPLQSYDVKLKDEATWGGLSLGIGALVGAILVTLGVDPLIIGATTPVAASLTRVLIGHFLPSGAA